MLPHLAKSFVMAMLFMPKPLPLADLVQWVRPDTKTADKGEKERALAVLSRLHIVTTSTARDEPQALTLTPNFAASLRLALTGGGQHSSFGVPTTNKHPNITIDFLDKYAMNQWEGILHYVVRTEGDLGGATYPSQSVRELLTIGALVERSVTQAGFAFLLQEVNAQVWTILLLWLENAEALAMDIVDLLSFFFLLGSLELGLAYSDSALSPPQKHILPVLRDLGLVYIVPHTSDFFPTRLATTLTSSASALRSLAATSETGAGAQGSGFIVIETNYRIYAYTSSPLQISVLKLFCKLSTRFPNMVAGRITRQSVREAIEKGITSDQIISYLSTHAHPQMRKKTPILPPTVVDQIRLWQIENERMDATPGFLFKDFETQAGYASCVGYAEEIGVLRWKSDGMRCFFVSRHEQLRDFIKSRKIK